jgi:hypothetical protein
VIRGVGFSERSSAVVTPRSQSVSVCGVTGNGVRTPPVIDVYLPEYRVTVVVSSAFIDSPTHRRRTALAFSGTAGVQNTDSGGTIRECHRGALREARQKKQNGTVIRSSSWLVHPPSSMCKWLARRCRRRGLHIDDGGYGPDRVTHRWRGGESSSYTPMTGGGSHQPSRRILRRRLEPVEPETARDRR